LAVVEELSGEVEERVGEQSEHEEADDVVVERIVIAGEGLTS
jgi:hypothetical protein